MSGHTVSRPGMHRPSGLQSVAVLLAGCATLTLAFGWFLRVDVTVDGRPVEMHAGGTLRDLIRGGATTGRAGDLLAADRSTVLRKGGGDRPTARVDGRPARLDRRLTGGETVSTRPGGDRVESTVKKRQTIPIPVEISGSGPLVRLASPGAAGLAVLEVGAVSGKVVATETVQPPVAMAVVRVPAPVSNRRVVALTFDDGPWPETTKVVLDVLRDRKVHATFFLVGNRVKKQPGLARRIAREGHLIGNHTETHRRLDTATKRTVRNQVRNGAARIRGATGTKPTWFRPPGGYLDSVVLAEAKRANERVVLWSVDPQDWRRPGWKKIASRVVKATHPGDVILLHDGGGDRRQTVVALKRIIDQLRRKGYRFVTLDELAEEKRAVSR